jgi:hypothetical protein
LLFNFALEYAIKKAQENWVGLKLNSIHQSLVYVDDVNLLGGKLPIIEKNKEALIDASLGCQCLRRQPRKTITNVYCL